MRSLLIGIFILAALTGLHCYEVNFPVKFNRFDSEYATSGVFESSLKSHVYHLQKDVVTFAGSQSVFLVNITSREVLREWFPLEPIDSAFIDTAAKVWYIGYDGYIRTIDLNTFQVGAQVLEGASRIREIYQFPGSKNLALHDRSGKKLHIVSPALQIVNTYNVPDAVNTDPRFHQNRGIFLAGTNYWFVNEEGIIGALPLNINFGYAQISSNGYLLIQTSDAVRQYHLYSFPAEGNPVRISGENGLETTLTSAEARVNFVTSTFIISDGDKKEVWEIDGENKPKKLWEGSYADKIADVLDFIGDENRSFVVNTDGEVQGYLWGDGSNDSAFLKETNFNYKAPTNNLFPEEIRSNLVAVGTTNHAFVGTRRVFIVNWKTTRKLVKAIETGIDEEIGSSLFIEGNKVILGFVGKLAVVDLISYTVEVHDNIQNVNAAVREIYRVPGTDSLALHQRNRDTVLYNMTGKNVVAVLKSTILPDRDPVFINNKMLIYSSTANQLHHFDLSDPSVPAASWNHSYSGINYIYRVPNSNFIFIQTNESPKRYFLWDSLNWNIGQQIEYMSYNAFPERIQAFSTSSAGQAYLVINQDYHVNIYKATGGSASLIYSKNQGRYTDIYTIDGVTGNYLLSSSTPTVRLLDTETHSIVERLTLSDVANDGVFSDGVNSHVYQVGNSQLHTYESKGKIFLINYNTKRIVGTITPEPSLTCESSLYLPEQHVWALGYSNLLILYNVITNTTTRFSSGLTSVVKRIYPVPGANKLLLHLRNLPQLVYDVSARTTKSFNSSFKLDRSPIVESNVALVYSPSSLYSELFNVSDPDAAPRRWDHRINPGVNYIVRIMGSPYILVQGVDRQLHIFDIMTLEKVSEVKSSFASPRIFSPSDNVILLSENLEYEIFKVDASGKASIPTKNTGPMISDVYQLLGQDATYLVANGNTELHEFSVETHIVEDTHLVYKIENLQRLQGTTLGYYAVNTASGDKWVNFENIVQSRYIPLWCDLRSLKGDIVAIREANSNRRHFLILTTEKSYIWNHWENKKEAEFERAVAASVQSGGEVVVYQSFADKKVKTFNWKSLQLGANVWSLPEDNLIVDDGIRAVDANTALLTVNNGINHYFAVLRFKNPYAAAGQVGENPQLTFAEGFKANKDQNSCTQTQLLRVGVVNPVVFTCTSDSTKLQAFDATTGNYLSGENFNILIRDDANRKILNFNIDDHPKAPTLVITTVPKSGSGQVIVEKRLISVGGLTPEADAVVARDVSNGAAFAIYGNAHLTKLGSHYSLYRVASTCPVGLTDFKIENSPFCFSPCGNKRVIVGDETCPTSCPTGWTEGDYLGTATVTSADPVTDAKVKVCVPPFTIDAADGYWDSDKILLEFDSTLNDTTLNSTACHLSEVLMLPAEALSIDGVKCGQATQRRRVLQAFSNSSLYVLAVSPVIALVDHLKEHLDGALTTLPKDFNAEKAAGSPSLLSAKRLALAAGAPTAADEIKLAFIRVSPVNNSLINITVNASHPSLLLRVGWTDNSNNKTNPTLEQLRKGLDGAGTALAGQASIISSVANQNITFLVDRVRSTRDRYAFFLSAETLDGSNLQASVVRFNQTLSFGSFSDRSVFGMLLALVAFVTLALF